MTGGPIIKGVALMTVAYQSVDAFDRNLSQVAAAGADFAEVSVGQLRVIGGGRLVPARMRRVEAVMARHALGYTVHCPLALDFMDERHADLHMAVARAGIAFCAAIGAGVFVVHPGWIPAVDQAARLDALMARERAALAELAEDAARVGVRLALENLPPILGNLNGNRTSYSLDPAKVAAQIAAVDHPALVGTIDFSHAWIAANAAGVDVVDSLRPLAPYANHLHVHDSFGRTPTMGLSVPIAPHEAMNYGMGDLHMPVGWGTVPWERLMSSLVIRPGTVMTLEIDGAYHDEEIMAEGVARARGFAELLEGAARSALAA